MFNTNNFGSALCVMGFTSDIYNSVFTDGDMSADFNSKTLRYPSTLRGREHNTSFSAPENFVVFECVHRLIAHGYSPEDIQLEKAWPLGRTQKSGRADICVYEHDTNDVLMIIECKTWGREFDKAKSDTLSDGAQLFSYWQQENSAKWLVLYSSDIKDGQIIYKSPAIDCSDDENLKLRAGFDPELKLYEKAHTVKEKFEVWQDTYNLELHPDVIFSSPAYSIGFKPIMKRDLVPIDEGKRIINTFEEILRHNNVSDKENAFNRLTALFICKLVDELTKGEDDELDFQYKPRADSYETLQDRLQHLYTEGMREFMKEEITYIPADYPDRLFATYKGSNRKKAIDELKSAFRMLKYFTNNDFAFKDVHNEKLFYQNGKILVEVVQLFQQYRIVQTQSHQTLGDLFEQLLDKGFKQNEGQFFTPTPITRFIWDSLPLRRFENPPRIIDYACGAGHFLTEAIEAVNYFMHSENNQWVQDCIFGIEKDYRLARVSKVSLFMNGAGNGNIIFGDGLEDTVEIKPGTFDILTANPPYSVAAFKQHLAIKNKFTLLDSIKSGGEIEVLFVERIAQLLNSKGIAAVILPSSILSNNSESYIGARKEILQHFMVRAIVKLGDKTFGATGTNTVILFLERYAFPPERSSLIEDCTDAIIAGRDLTDWEDEDILREYLRLQGLSLEDWHAFIEERLSEDMPEYFRAYREAFGDKFYSKAKDAEHQKVFYFGMTYRQRTAVILAPSDKTEQKEFLGYDWSNRKGSEGIRYETPRGGKMYVDADREATGTLAHVVRQAFGDGEVVMTEDNARYARVVRLSDMLDFSRTGFNASVSLQERKGFEIASKYPMRKLGSLCVMNISKSEANSWSKDTMATFLDMSAVSTNGEIIMKTDRPLNELWTGSYSFFCEGDIICAKMMSNADSMKCAIAKGLTNGIGFGSSEFYTFRVDNEKVLTGYICEFLNLPTVRESAWKSVTGTGRLRVPAKFYEDLTIPLPPMDIQRKIVQECQAIDDITDTLNAQIAAHRERIEELFSNLDSLPAVSHFTIEDRRAFILAIGKRVLNSQLIPNGTIPVFSANVREPFGYVDGLLKGFEDFSQDAILWGIDGDFMVSFRAKDNPFYPTDHCGVLRVITDKVHPRYMAHVLEREGLRVGFSRSYRASLDRVGGISFNVPSIEAQEQAMHEVMELEAKITQAQQELQIMSGSKASILHKYI